MGALFVLMAADLPFQRDRMEERAALFRECDPNGNGFCSLAEIQSALDTKYGFGGGQHSAMLHAFDSARNYSGTESGSAASYVERREFRIFLEIFKKNLDGESGEPDTGDHH